MIKLPENLNLEETAISDIARHIILALVASNRRPPGMTLESCTPIRRRYEPAHAWDPGVEDVVHLEFSMFDPDPMCDRVYFSVTVSLD